MQELRSPLQVAQKAIRLATQAENKADRYDEIWCVFDVDDTTRENVERAVHLAEAKGIRIAYSNESFELWYILHFEYILSADGLNGGN